MENVPKMRIAASRVRPERVAPLRVMYARLYGGEKRAEGKQGMPFCEGMPCLLYRRAQKPFPRQPFPLT